MKSGAISDFRRVFPISPRRFATIRARNQWTLRFRGAMFGNWTELRRSGVEQLRSGSSLSHDYVEVSQQIALVTWVLVIKMQHYGSRNDPKLEPSSPIQRG